MKNSKKILGTGILTLAGFFIIAVDHKYAPALTDSDSDIIYLYAFWGKNTNNLVFVTNLQGLLSPTATASAVFDENGLIEFNINNMGDSVEDLVIQAIPRKGRPSRKS
ncbi:hypothetical protein [Flavivirga sp. 57AJ16]|uniref:hypothetical protein n=1 Tax=Flavivirga sp. 57AJ16 TaxID=3025307 RepID=UPI00236735E2|nr:hypothetical protein [Flavivirga sp. 57AJ16]MDD7887070.1 hypothetical protein [Flavivirga sp. 57AJ16]